jgi:DNA polymerase-3 subunit delta'
MSLEDIPGQPRTKRFLKRLLRSGNVPHALLFSGMAGIGKTAMARELAKLLNCHHPREWDCCDECPSCRKLNAGHHPDLIWVSREGTFIKIEQIRDIQGRLRFRPFEGKWRVIVLQNAQDLKEEAANSLLKLLEEPPKQNVFILTAIEPQMLLPTLVSRCCHVRFQPLEEAWIAQHLVTTLQIPPSRAAELARLSDGSLDRAQWLAEENRLDRWNEILDGIEKLETLPMMEFFPLMNQWVQKTDDLEQDMEWIKLWLRDLICSRLVSDHHPIFQTHETFHRRIGSVKVDFLFTLYDQIEQAVQHLRQNANKQLTLEGVCLAIRDGLYGQGHRNSFSSGGQNLSF